MAGRNALEIIKRDLEPFVGKKVMVRANQGRRKVFETEGILEKDVYKRQVIGRSERRYLSNAEEKSLLFHVAWCS